METRERINALESRQLELLGIMASSDAHAAKCIKLGKPFAEAYPGEHAAYLAANTEFNDNEKEIERLRGVLESEQSAEDTERPEYEIQD